MFVVVVAFFPLHVFCMSAFCQSVSQGISDDLFVRPLLQPLQKTCGNNSTEVQKRSVSPEAMAAKGIEQRHLFLLYQSVVLSVIDYRLVLTTMAQTNLLTLDRVQDEAMRSILGTTKNTPTETMRFMLDLPPMQGRQKVGQVEAYSSAVENPHNPLHERHKGMQAVTGQVLGGSSRVLSTASMPADRTQSYQGVGKVPKPIPASL